MIALVMRDQCLKLNQLFVHPDHQGHSIGGQCLQQLLDRATDLGLPIRYSA